jgi:protoheme IX farnesyltransferase
LVNKFSKIKNKLMLLFELGKLRITFFVAFSTTAGYILASGKIDFGIIIPTLGVFIIAAGASAMNHYQERKTDAIMNRTKNRPIPSGAIKPTEGLFYSLLWIVSGSVILGITTGIIGMALGVIAVFWYNGFYTPLKKKTAMAVVPGALIGSISPAIGWVAGGGYILDPQIFAIGLFFFIWQVPHFWLLLLMYKKDYERAGFPVLSGTFNDEQISRITYAWIIVMVISGLIIPLFLTQRSYLVYFILLLYGIWVIWQSRNLMFKYYERLTFRFAFREINTYVLIVLILLSITKLINIV